MPIDLATWLICPACQGQLQWHVSEIECKSCAARYPIVNGVPVFTEVPATIDPWDKVARGREQGTPWRRANWRFLEQQVQKLPANTVFLDIGAGHGDFTEIFHGRNYISLDIVPYPEVNLAVDLTRHMPFRPGSFDAVVLMNVMEHVFDTDKLMAAIATLLKPGGQLIAAIPFLHKVHQAPYDFVRYTQYGLAEVARTSGLQIELMQGFFTPIFLLNEQIGNIWGYSLPELTGIKRLTAKIAVFVLQQSSNVLRRLLGEGRLRPLEPSAGPAPFGYVVVFHKPA